jgi:hypothetical protein
MNNNTNNNRNQDSIFGSGLATGRVTEERWYEPLQG